MTSCFEALPPELLHRVFALLEKPDVLSARAACSVFAAIGNDYLLDIIYLVAKLQRCERLLQVARHPVISRRVKKLYWQADSWNGVSSYDDWNLQRQQSCVNPIHGYTLSDECPDDAVNPDMDGERIRRAFKRAYEKFNHNLGTMYSDNKLREAYDAYAKCVEDWQRTCDTSHDVECLTALLQGCTNLDDVIITFAHEGPHGTRLNFKYFAFEETLTCPILDTTALVRGPQPLIAVCKAVVASGSCLRGLTLCAHTFHILNQNAETLQLMKDAMRNLHRFKVMFQPSGETDEDEELSAHDSSRCFAEGRLAELLSTAHELRTLKLHFMLGTHGDGSAQLKDVAPQRTWPRLRDVGLSYIVTTEDEIVDFLLRHRHSLRSLSLSEMHLNAPSSWDRVFQRVAGRLTRLKKVQLRSGFSSPLGNQFDFSLPGMTEDQEDDPYRHAVEQYVLNGGEYPNFDELDSMSEGERDAITNEIGHASQPEREYTSDGSVVAYGSDSFDEAL